MADGLRLLLYDRTCVGPAWRPGLTHAWRTGAVLYRALDRFDACCGVADWHTGLRWLAQVQPDEPIAELQFWGHGKWGVAKLDDEALGLPSLGRSHPHRRGLDALRRRMLPAARSLVWFRTCETLGAAAGQRFATALAEDLGCQVAGHTYIIGWWQSGLHRLRPGQRPTWSPDEGLVEGTANDPRRAAWSSLSAPATISCLHGSIPEQW